MKTELGILQMAYNELRGLIDEAYSSEYLTETGAFYLKKNYEGEITRVYKKNGCTEERVEEIDVPILSILQKDYERDRPFSILIDNTNKDKESFIFYHEEFFKTKEQAKEKIAKIIEIAIMRKRQIKSLYFWYRNNPEFDVYFDKKNKIERVMSPSFFNADDIVGGFDKSFYNFDDFIASNEILLTKKIAMLFGLTRK